MGIKRILKKVANYILFSEPKQIVHVEIGQIKNGQTLKDNNIVITGGSKGIGYAMAKRCIEEGWQNKAEAAKKITEDYNKGI